MGSNEPTVGEMETSYLFKVPFTKQDVDVTIIAGKPSNRQVNHYPLLLLRFWNQVIQTRNVNFKKFYDECMELIPRQGVSVSRLGGSSGTLHHTQGQKKLFEFLSLPGSFPRKTGAVKFVNRQLYLQCLYISPYSGLPTHRAKYSPVHCGGAFKPSQRLVKQFPFLLNFAEAKIKAALLVKVLNQSLPFSIHQAAVEKEVGVIRNCDASSRKLLCRDFINMNTHTLVCHAVGYHRDNFSDGQPSLENKICFVVPTMTGVGRGGAGRNKYVVSLLDW